MIKAIFKDNIAILKLNHCRMNGLNTEFLTSILDKLTDIESNEEIHIIVIVSDLPYGFSSGLDIRNLYIADNPNHTSENILKVVKLVYELNKFILASKKIFIAGLSGAIIGSSVSIALSCDFRIADESAWFWLPDPQLGGLLADGGIDLLNHLIGASRAKILLLTNDRISAVKAYEFGLLYCLTPKNNLMDTVLHFAERISGYSYNTLVTTKEIINSNSLKDFQEKKLRKIVFSEEMHMCLRSFFIAKEY